MKDPEPESKTVSSVFSKGFCVSLVYASQDHEVLCSSFKAWVVSTANNLERWRDPRWELWRWEEMPGRFGVRKKHPDSSRMYFPRKGGVGGCRNVSCLPYSLESVSSAPCPEPALSAHWCPLVVWRKFFLPTFTHKKLPRLSPRKWKAVHPPSLPPWLRGLSKQALSFADTPFNFFYSVIQKTFKTTSAAKLCPYGGTYAPRPEHGKRAPCKYTAHWDVHTQQHTLWREEGFCEPKGMY